MKILYIHHPQELPKLSFQRYLQQLPFPLQQKILRYRFWKDRQAGLWGKLLLMKGLEEMGYSKNTLQHLQYTSYQRPYFPKNLELELDFNISHSGYAVACAISLQQRIGIDIEQIRPIEIHHFSQQFSPEEMQKMYDAPDTQRTFFERWCQKEAIIKVDGRGLSIPLPQVKIGGLQANIGGEIFHLKPLELLEGYVSCLASTQPIEEVELEEVNIGALSSLKLFVKK